MWETPPKTASVVYEPSHQWHDDNSMSNREAQAAKPRPWSVYEVHIGSMKKLADDGNRSLNYRELAVELVDYVADMGFTHIRA